MSGGRVLAVLLGILAILAGLTLSGGGGLARGLDALFDGGASGLVQGAGSAVIVGEVSRNEFQIGSGSYEGDFELRVSASAPEGDPPIFVGVGRSADVAAYLDGAERSADLLFSAPGGGGVSAAAPPDPRIPAPPAEQAFWAASSAGRGEQSIEWGVEGGAWTFVVMRADGARGVVADVSASTEVAFLDWAASRVTTEVIVGGLLLVVVGVLLLVLGLRGRRRGPPPGPTEAPLDPPVNPVGKF
jgi:hypothetical protein